MGEVLLKAIAESMEELEVHAGFVIIQQDARGDVFYVIKDGEAIVTVCTISVSM